MLSVTMQERNLGRSRAAVWRIVSLQASLLGASILSSCFLLISAWSHPKIPITMQPEKPSTGDNLTLTPRTPADAGLCCYWFHGPAEEPNLIVSSLFFSTERRYGPAHTGRETPDSNCSLHITGLMPRDAGLYTVKVSGHGLDTTGEATLVVSDSIKTGAGIISRIVVGSLVSLTLFGTLLCFLFRTHSLRSKTPTPKRAPKPSFYRNAAPEQALQHGDQAECDQLTC